MSRSEGATRSSGWILDPAETLPYRPYHPHDRVEPKIDFETLIRLGATRTIRNKWLHELEPATLADSARALGLTDKLLSTIGSINLHAALVSRISRAAACPARGVSELPGGF